MEKKGNLYQAYKDVINPLDNKKIGRYLSFYYTKIAKDMYLICIESVFKKDPIKLKYAIINEKKFKKLSKDHILQQ